MAMITQLMPRYFKSKRKNWKLKENLVINTLRTLSGITTKSSQKMIGLVKHDQFILVENANNLHTPKFTKKFKNYWKMSFN